MGILTKKHKGKFQVVQLKVLKVHYWLMCTLRKGEVSGKADQVTQNGAERLREATRRKRTEPPHYRTIFWEICFLIFLGPGVWHFLESLL